MRKGADSAYAPTVAQVQQAIRDGVSWWCPYLAGPGALHNWSPSEVDGLRQGGLNDCLPVFVPRLVAGRIDPNANPEADAQTFIAACQAAGISGVGALDTEASMRGDPWTATYTSRFCAELRRQGWIDVCYAGGFTAQAPPQGVSFIWWIVASTNPPANVCYQYGSGTEGVSVDYDAAGDGFPFATLHGGVPGPTPTPPGPVINSWPEFDPNGGPLPSTTLTIPTDGSGNGWVMLDGSDARVGHFVLPYAQSLPPDREGSNPARDKSFWKGNAHRNNTNGYVCLSVTDTGVPNFQANVTVTWTGTAPAALTREEAVARFGEENIITHENWADFNPVAVGGGAHDPQNATDQPTAPAE